MWALLFFFYWGMSAIAGPVYTSVNGSYNSFLGQVGFCKAQSFETRSRDTSTPPHIFYSGKVLFGVGLSHVQFNNSIVSCGRCIHVLSIDHFYWFNEGLTNWDYNKPHQGNLTAMVFDECTDPICNSGFLDFDIYNERQPVANGNPSNITWEFVPCPVGDEDRIGFLICLGYGSCKMTDPDGRLVGDLFHQSIQDNAFTIYPRNHRIAITSMMIQGEPLEDNQAWLWASQKKELLEERQWLMEWTNEDETRQSWVLDWTQYFLHTSTPGYRGGFIFHTNQQN